MSEEIESSKITAAGDASVAIENAPGAFINTGSVVINQVPIPEELVLSSEEARAAILAFLQDIETRFKETRLFHTKQPILLKDQYVPIQVTLEPHKRDVETLRGYWETEEELKRAYALKGGEEELKRQQMDWKEAKQKHQRIMVLADPGMGKSTLLRMEAGTTAQQELQKLQNNQTTIDHLTLPLFLRLSELAKRSEELIESIPLLIQRDYPNTALPILPFLLQKLKAGQCLLLLDALDEVPKLDRNRIELKEKLDRFIQNYPCSVICTSRIVGYDGNFLMGGQEVEIVPFGKRQIGLYVTTWFTNAAEYISDESVSAVALMRELRSKPQVRGLVQNPLLLSLICSLYQEKGLTLPARRAQVYEKAVEYMLVKWSKEKREPRKGEEDWADLKQELLEELAYQFSCEDTEVFSRRDLRRKIDQYLRNEEVPSEFRNVTASDLLVELTEQDGILQKLNSDDDQYLFLHRTFQEYLTACYLERAKDGIELAKEHSWKYDWHETISLMAGLMKNPLPLLQAITDEKDDIFQTQLLLAGRCLAECGASSHPLITETIDRIYQFWLSYPNLEFIRSVVVAVGQTHPLLCEQLQNLLDHGNRDIEWKAAEVLGRIGNEKGIDILIAALNKENRDTRWKAVEVLGRIGNERAVDALISALNDKEGIVRGSAAEALGMIGNGKAVDALIPLLNDTDGEGSVGESAAGALRRIGNDRAVHVLTSALNNVDREVRQNAAGALGRIGSETAVNALIPLLKDEDRSVRESTAWALAMIGSDKATDALISALNDEYSNVRWKAAWALGRIGNEKYIDSLILALKDENSTVRWKAIEALGEIGNEKAVDALITLLNDTDDYVRGSVAEALGEIGNEKAVDALITLLNDTDDYVSDSAVWALGKIGNDKAIDLLIADLNSENSYARVKAAESLAQIDNNRAINALFSVLSDEDSNVSWSAIWALGKAGYDKALDALILVLNDRENVLAGSTVELLRKIGNDKAIDALITALNHKDSYVRRRAAVALEQIGSSVCLAKLIQSPQIDIHRSDVFLLTRSLAIRFHRDGLPFISVYPERVAGVQDKRLNRK